MVFSSLPLCVPPHSLQLLLNLAAGILGTYPSHCGNAAQQAGAHEPRKPANVFAARCEDPCDEAQSRDDECTGAEDLLRGVDCDGRERRRKRTECDVADFRNRRSRKACILVRGVGCWWGAKRRALLRWVRRVECCIVEAFIAEFCKIMSLVLNHN